MRGDKKDKSLLFRILKGASYQDEDIIEEGLLKEEVPEEEILEADFDDEDFEVNEGEKSLDDRMAEEGNYLEAVRRRYLSPDEPAREEAFYSDFILGGTEPDEEKKEFLEEIQSLAKQYIDEDQASAMDGYDDEPYYAPSNAQVCIKISSDEMEAWMFAFPPKHGGKHFTEELIQEALEESGVVYGVDDALVRKIVRKSAYLRMAVVAKGVREIDGIDGKVTDYFPRVIYKKTEINKQAIDYNKLKCLHPVIKGTLICELTYPVEGVDGSTVTGKIFPCRKAEPFIIPAGSNMVLTEDQTALIATMDGTLFFDGERFQVKDVMHVLADVDLSVGDIDTIGDLEIQGDVLSGFTVRATGNITIGGMVSNSVVVAGGDIKINMGIKGIGSGILEAGGNIECSYMESCTVRAKGNIRSGSIVNCEVFSDRNVESDVIVGGSITALRQIHAKTIGNNQRKSVTFYLGNTKEIRQEKITIETDIPQIDKELGRLEKEIRFLKNKSRLLEEDKKQLAELKAEFKENEKCLKKKKKRLQEINEGISDFSHCELTANDIYPPATVCLAGDSCVISTRESMCRIWSDDGEISRS